MRIGPVAFEYMRMPRYLRFEIGWRKAWAATAVFSWWK